MINDHEEMLATLQQSVKMASSELLNITNTIINEQVSNYPILVAFQGELSLELGLPTGVSAANWVFNATTLEELFTKNVVKQEKVDNFREVYNHKSQHFCVLLINGQGAEFVFIPV